MDSGFDFDHYKDLLDKKQYQKLRKELPEQNEVDIAHFIETLDKKLSTLAFRMLPKDMAADVFSYLPSESQHFIIESITEQELSRIVEDLFVDDAVDILEELPANVVNKVLKNAQPETRRLINQFLKYQEDTAGSIMTAEFIELRKNMSVGEAISKIRQVGESKETIYTCYVIDDFRFLDGVITVKDLLLSKDDEKLEKLMTTSVIKVMTSDDREEAAQLFTKYGLLAIPVVDQENRLVGIVTVDDAVDVLEQEATEDFEKMAAVLPYERPYLKTTVLTHAKNRIVWLMVLMVSSMITGLILGRHEATFAALPILITFIPMLTDTGGNAGSQSSTLIIRGMAVSEITPSDLGKVLWKELRISLLVGFVLAMFNFFRILLLHTGGIKLAFTVSLSLYATVIFAKSIGCSLPVFAKVTKLDPAIMASPMITTIVDAISLLIYSSLAVRLLGL